MAFRTQRSTNIRVSLRAHVRVPRGAAARISVEAFGWTAVFTVVVLAAMIAAILHIWHRS